jgi:hypothetical protein
MSTLDNNIKLDDTSNWGKGTTLYSELMNSKEIESLTISS